MIPNERAGRNHDDDTDYPRGRPGRATRTLAECCTRAEPLAQRGELTGERADRRAVSSLT
jgi:hypothetical protein